MAVRCGAAVGVTKSPCGVYKRAEMAPVLPLQDRLPLLVVPVVVTGTNYPPQLPRLQHWLPDHLAGPQAVHGQVEPCAWQRPWHH